MNKIDDLMKTNKTIILPDYLEPIEKDRINFCIKELEKIKTEIIACTDQENTIAGDIYNFAINRTIRIIERHIKELKGEDNAEIL